MNRRYRYTLPGKSGTLAIVHANLGVPDTNGNRVVQCVGADVN